VAVSLVLVAVCATAGFFAFARPRYEPAVTSKTIDMSSREHYTALQVKSAFAAHGIALVERNSENGFTFYSNVRRLGAKDDGFLVTIYRPSMKISFGTTGPKPRFEKLVGNVDVYYGGLSPAFADRVAAAASTLGR
jgi:hypothetical protein